MDTEVLRTLQEIRGGVYVLDVIGAAALIVWIIRAGSQIAAQLHSVVTAQWRKSANTMFAKKQYEALVKHCMARLKDLPNDEWALWWSGRAYHALGNSNLSRQQFQRIWEIAPTWRKSVEPYLASDIVGDASR